MKTQPNSDSHDAILTALRAAPTESVDHLRRSCYDGTVNGRRFDSCFFGILAKGAGASFYELTDDEVFKTTADFARSIGIDLHPHGPRHAAEDLCLNVYWGDKYHTSSELRVLARACEQVLRESHSRPYIDPEELHAFVGQMVTV